LRQSARENLAVLTFRELTLGKAGGALKSHNSGIRLVVAENYCSIAAIMLHCSMFTSCSNVALEDLV
jgi:hypothetical protein